LKKEKNTLSTRSQKSRPREHGQAFWSKLKPDGRISLKLLDVGDGQAEDEVHEDDGHVEDEDDENDFCHPEIFFKFLYTSLILIMDNLITFSCYFSVNVIKNILSK